MNAADYVHLQVTVCKVVPYSITNVGYGADPDFLAVSPQMTLVIYPVLGCRYFPPDKEITPLASSNSILFVADLVVSTSVISKWVQSNLPWCYLSTSSLVFSEVNFRWRIHAEECVGSCLASFGGLWPKYVNRRNWSSYTVSLFIAKVFVTSTFLFRSLSVTPQILLSTDGLKHLRYSLLYCCFSVQVSALHNTVDWTNVYCSVFNEVVRQWSNTMMIDFYE